MGNTFEVLGHWRQLEMKLELVDPEDLHAPSPSIAFANPPDAQESFGWGESVGKGSRVNILEKGAGRMGGRRKNVEKGGREKILKKGGQGKSFEKGDPEKSSEKRGGRNNVL